MCGCLQGILFFSFFSFFFFCKQAEEKENFCGRRKNANLIYPHTTTCKCIYCGWWKTSQTPQWDWFFAAAYLLPQHFRIFVLRMFLVLHLGIWGKKKSWKFLLLLLLLSINSFYLPTFRTCHKDIHTEIFSNIWRYKKNHAGISFPIFTSRIQKKKKEKI